MFKRRKPDEAGAREPGAPAFAPQPFAPQTFAPQPGAPYAFAPLPLAEGEMPGDGLAPDAAGIAEAMLDGGIPGGVPGGIHPGEGHVPDSGLGVPPFRPAPIPMPHKEASMARPPLPTPNPPAPQPSASGRGPGMGMGGPMGQGSMGQGSMGGQGMMPGEGPGRGLRPQGAQQAPERRTLVVGRGISVQGTVQDAERLVVEGTVEASLIKATELSIALGGLFKGEVEVQDAEVAGTIDGTLTASGNLVVRATGKVLGVARCRRLQVEDGGAITGRIEMLTEDSRTAVQDTAA